MCEGLCRLEIECGGIWILIFLEEGDVDYYGWFFCCENFDVYRVGGIGLCGDYSWGESFGRS